MNAGRLRFRVKVLRAIETKTQMGGVTQTWKEFKRLMADIEEISGREKFSLMQAKAQIDTKITTRVEYAADITPKMRFAYQDPRVGERIFDIEANINVRGRNMREFHCKEVA